ncbi:tyrosine phosphatase [Diaporthe amygdali]|uniref:tyrosine phosphatase n=1 Tax=Phomopsis amygdali TaxID=1214568 RepID=UPI0022FE9356|nr:tyrosine phosphatase [Diaporthe amygdali]KAJ0124708.1 tyrosine phosphatase [Diaporthe amygdali]
MDAAKTAESAKGQKGLKQRKSFLNTTEQSTTEEVDVGLEELVVPVQSIEMQRSQSGQFSLKSKASTSSLATETSMTKETVGSRNILGQPANFGTVAPGIYRSSYPQEADYAFLQKLRLKTIVTLVDKELPETFLPFMKANSIQHRHITMQGTKKETIPIQTMSAILQVVHDKRNHPLLIHCNHGRHRTGCVVALVRKIQKWDSERVLDEYRAYASPKIRDCDVEYITKFQTNEVQHLALAPLAESFPGQHALDARRIRFFLASFLTIFIWWTTLRFFRRDVNQRDAVLGL